MQALSIYIVEDELIVVEELKGALLKLGYNVIGFAYNVKDAINQILQLKPDLLLLDINLKNEHNGGIIIAETVKTHYNPLIVYITAYSDKETVMKVKNTNPEAYLLKPINDKQLEVTLDLISDKIVEKTSDLTAREMEILQLIKNGYSSKNIAEKLFLSEHTIRTHRKNILAKTDSKNITELIANLITTNKI